MRRFSIGKLMLLVAFLGANFGVIRFLYIRMSSGAEFTSELLAGFVPLADVIVLAAYSPMRHIRVRLRKRPQGQRGSIAAPFSVIGAAMLTLGVSLALWSPGILFDFLEVAAALWERLLGSAKLLSFQPSTLVSHLLTLAFIGVCFSGPPLVAALAIASKLSRFQLVVTSSPEGSRDAQPS